MLKFGNKEFRNLQEQVFKNMSDIAYLKEAGVVLDEFGIKVVGQESSTANMPTVADYKELNPEWAYGDAYAIGTEAPYELYILTREDANHIDDYWFNIGEFPMPGPQGEQGIQGPQGVQGPQGNPGSNGAAAGFGQVSATATTLEPSEAATVTVSTSGPDTSKSFSFTFGIPQGEPGEDAEPVWGTITGDLSDQTDLVNVLQGKQNTLVSGTSIKTINNESLLGSGNISVSGSAIIIEYGDTTINVPQLLTAVRNGASIVVTDGEDDVQYYYLKDVVTNSDDSQVDMCFTTEFMNSARTSAYISQTKFRYSNNSVTWSEPEVITIPTVNYPVTDVTVDGTSVLDGTVAKVNLSGKQDVISDLSTIREGAALGATAYQKPANGIPKADLTIYVQTGIERAYGAVQPSAIADMATQTWVGQQGYLTGITSSDITTALGYTPGTSNFSGSYTDLTNKPSIPSKTSDLTNDSGFIDKSVNDLTYYTLTSSLATVATSGSYNDLSNLPVIPEAPVQSDWLEDDSDDLSFIKNKPSLATVATSGSYNDLTDKPTIPSNYVTTDTGTVFDPQIVTGVKKFSTPIINQIVWTDDVNSHQIYSNSGIEILNYDISAGGDSHQIGLGDDSAGLSIVGNAIGINSASSVIVYTNDGTQTPLYGCAFPDTHTWTAQKTLATTDQLFSGSYNDLTDKPTIPAAQVNADWTASSGVAEILHKPNLATVATSGSYNDLSNTPTIPTATSDLNNDSGFITSSALSGYATETWVTSQGYADASDIPTDVSELNNDAGYITSSVNNLTNYYDKEDVDDLIDNVAEDIPVVYGTNDGTNWTSITINSDTYSIPSGGSSSNVIDVTSISPTESVSAADLALINADPFNYVLRDTTYNWLWIPMQKVSSSLTYQRWTKISNGAPEFWTINLNLSTGVFSSSYSGSVYGSSYETWTFTLSDGTTTTKDIVIK